MTNYINISAAALWVLVVFTAILTLAVIVIIAYHISAKRNGNVEQRRANTRLLTNYILMAGITFMTIYIILVSASGQYRGASQWWGFALVGIGIAISLAVCLIGYRIAIHVWNKAHIERCRRNKIARKYKTERDFFIRCLEMNEAVIDLNPYAEDLPEADD